MRRITTGKHQKCICACHKDEQVTHYPGTLCCDEDGITVIKPVKNSSGTMSNAEWSIKAKQAGYPLCKYCEEPLPKYLWSKGFHYYCNRAEQNINLRNSMDEDAIRRYRQESE